MQSIFNSTKKEVPTIERRRILAIRKIQEEEKELKEDEEQAKVKKKVELLMYKPTLHRKVGGKKQCACGKPCLFANGKWVCLKLLEEEVNKEGYLIIKATRDLGGNNE